MPFSHANTSEFGYASKVLIPEEEFLSYFDSNGIYTVVGNVKNENNFAVIPIITVLVKDDSMIHSKTIQHVPLASGKEIPFKIKFPEILGNTPILMPPKLAFNITEKDPVSIEILYDKTLIKHDDGHITARIQNIGDKTVYYPKVYAVVHGYEMVLDIVQNIEFIEKIEPGEIVEFSMYPDLAITEDVFYYSCFAITNSFVRPMYAERNGENFYYRYDSGTWFTSPQFNNEGTELSLRTLNSYPLETYANFEFPAFSDDEKFSVYVNGEKKKIIQSIDERGNWHVAYTVQPREGGEVLITGFKEGWDPGDRILLPDWVKVNASWWANELGEDELFVKGVEFMIKEKIIIHTNTIKNDETTIPNWFKNTTKWWVDEKIDNETFVNVLQNLINREIIKIQ
ncbi:MAG: peptidase [Nitrosopumilus sp.]|nr:peptidase [Nitrosopumilus sp.]MDH3487425.1 peptidase [Nitrosopumilus sp.]